MGQYGRPPLAFSWASCQSWVMAKVSGETGADLALSRRGQKHGWPSQRYWRGQTPPGPHFLGPLLEETQQLHNAYEIQKQAYRFTVIVEVAVFQSVCDDAD